MSLNKLQIKAEVFKLVEDLRDISAIDDVIVEDTLSKLRAIDGYDPDFIARILIKEADSKKNQKSATVFLYLAENLAPESFAAHILNELNSPFVSDEQKIFFVNILSGLGINFLPADMGNYLKNPDEAINSETSRFLEAAKIDPEARIDFLDFYFASPDSDKRELVDSVVSDFSGDRLVNILSPLVLTIDDEDTVLYCLDIIEKSKSLLSVKPLKYMENFKNSKKISEQASKILRKMQMSGVYTEEKYIEFNKKLMDSFEKPECIVSPPDGNSNFTMAISRKNKDGSYYIFFVSLNTELGPFSCFGFSSITKREYDTITGRFFSVCEKIYLTPEEAKALLTDLVIKRINANKIVPYEYFCWERMLDDIEQSAKTTDEILKENIKPIKVDEICAITLLSSEYALNWFFKYSKNNPVFSKYIDKILLLTNQNINTLDDIIIECAEEPELRNKIIIRIKYLAYFLLRAKKTALAKKYYSIIYNEDALNEVMVTIIKKSSYEHMLNMRMPKKNTNSFFNNKSEIINKDEIKTAEFFINYMEKAWMGDYDIDIV